MTLHNIILREGYKLGDLVSGRVGIYRNLHKKCYSIKSIKLGRVVAYAGLYSEFVLTDVDFKVSQAGRERVLKTKNKNVHALIVGNIHFGKNKLDCSNPVMYNPYKFSEFTNLNSGLPVLKSPEVVFSGGKILTA